MRGWILGAVLMGACGGAGAGGEVWRAVDSLRTAGLAVDDARAMGPGDYGVAPVVCAGVRFRVPAAGAGKGGRVFFCSDPGEGARLAGFYRELGRVSGWLFSWVFERGAWVLQLNGDLEEGLARRYEAALPSPAGH